MSPTIAPTRFVPHREVEERPTLPPRPAEPPRDPSLPPYEWPASPERPRRPPSRTPARPNRTPPSRSLPREPDDPLDPRSRRAPRRDDADRVCHLLDRDEHSYCGEAGLALPA